MKKYMFVGGELNGTYSEETAKYMFEKYGNGLLEDLTESRERGALVHRRELDNQYQFKGYLGPMWDGERYIVDGDIKYAWEVSNKERETCKKFYVLRYETKEVYDALSR